MLVRMANGFRRGNTLATTFTGTLSERHGEPVERVPSPERLLDWFRENGLAVDSCTPDQLHRARDLREAIDRAATAVAGDSAPPAAAIETINRCSEDGRAWATLTSDGRTWRLASSSVEDALSVVAADAIDLLSGQRDGRLARCASPSCQAVFLDTSQSRTRRWCDMNTCGNRQKKARLKARSTGGVRRDA